MKRGDFDKALAGELKEVKAEQRGVLPDVLDDLFEQINFRPFQTDAAGNVLHNAKGKPLLDWGNIVQGTVRLITKLVAIYYRRRAK